MSAANEIKIRLMLIRHGITQGNIEKRYMGQTDMDLCKEGVRQIQEKVDSGYYKETELLFISPLKRCRQTADIIFPGMDKIVIEELKEMDFGDFEGKNYHDLSHNPVYEAYISSGGELSFPNGENKQQFSKRVMEGLGKALRIAADNDKRNITCVVHGGTTMAICSCLGLAGYFDSIVGNGGLLEIDITYDKISGSYSGSFVG